MIHQRMDSLSLFSDAWTMADQPPGKSIIIAGVVILDRDAHNKYTWEDPVTLKLSQTLEISGKFPAVFVEAWWFMHKTQVRHKYPLNEHGYGK